MYNSNENISADIVRRKTGSIVEKLAPKLGIDPSKVSAIGAAIVEGLVACRTIDKITTIEVARAVAPQIPALGQELYDYLKSCSEKERIITTGITVGAAVLVFLGKCVAEIAIEGIVQSGKTQRAEIRWGTLKSFSPSEMIKSWR